MMKCTLFLSLVLSEHDIDVSCSFRKLVRDRCLHDLVLAFTGSASTKILLIESSVFNELAGTYVITDR